MDREHIFKIIALEREEDKLKKAKSSSNIRGDDKIPTTKFKEQRDDRRLKLHKASLLRLPILEPEKWYDQVPSCRDEMFKSIPLKATGSEHCMSDVAIEKLHNRTTHLALKYFLPENISVSAKPMRETRKYEEEGLSTVTDLAWETATTVHQATEAIVSYGCALHQLWPTDHTGWAMMRLFHKYKWLVNVQPAKTRANLIAVTFNRITKTNCVRAANAEAPITFEEMDTLLKSVLTRNNFRPDVPVSGFKPDNDISSKSHENKPGQRFPNNPQNKLPQIPLVGGMKPCWGFNDFGKVCTQALQPGNYSCKNPKGVAFAHACSNWIPSRNSYCLQRHSKRDCRSK